MISSVQMRSCINLFQGSSSQYTLVHSCWAHNNAKCCCNSVLLAQKLNLPCRLVNCSANSTTISCCKGCTTGVLPSLCGKGIGVECVNANRIFFKMLFLE